MLSLSARPAAITVRIPGMLAKRVGPAKEASGGAGVVAAAGMAVRVGG